MEVLKKLSQSVQIGDIKEVKNNISRALEENIHPRIILHEGLMKGLEIVGEKFKCNEAFIPELLYAAKAMHIGIDLIKPELIKLDVKNIGKVLIGTVKGDIHDIGKRLVGIMLEGVGFEVIDIGTDVSSEEFIYKIKENKPDIVGLSSLISFGMAEMRNTIKSIEEEGIREQVKIMVGGACITAKFAQEIGADAYAKDAVTAASIAKESLI